MTSVPRGGQEAGVRPEGKADLPELQARRHRPGQRRMSTRTRHLGKPYQDLRACCEQLEFETHKTSTFVIASPPKNP